MCYIADGRAGACDRYANEGGQLVRVDLLTILERRSRLDSDESDSDKSDAGRSDAGDRATGMAVPLASDDEPWMATRWRLRINSSPQSVPAPPTRTTSQPLL